MGKYRFIVVSPKIIMQKNGMFGRLFKIKTFKEKLRTIVFDEAHCISKWGSFWPEYQEVGQLHYILPHHVRYYVTSATLSKLVLQDILQILNLQHEDTEFFLRPNDRPNVFLSVQQMKYLARSYKDLDFLVQGGTTFHKKFMIFVDSIKESEAIVKYLHSRLNKENRNDIIWYHSMMSDEFRETEAIALTIGERKGATSTDSFGMVSG